MCKQTNAKTHHFGIKFKKYFQKFENIKFFARISILHTERSRDRENEENGVVGVIELTSTSSKIVKVLLFVLFTCFRACLLANLIFLYGCV